jgi:hypothetical protein
MVFNQGDDTMALNNYPLHSPLAPSCNTPAVPAMAGSIAAPRAAAESSPWTMLWLGLALVVLAGLAVLYPLSIKGGILARTWGDVVAVNPAAQTLTLDVSGATVTVPLEASTLVYFNDRPITLEELRSGDRVRVRYDSVFKLSALEIQAIGSPIR